jgi:hypothetical protein
MVKKIISAVLIPILLLQLSSCYSMSGISHEELISQQEKSDIRITTFLGETFEFNSFEYYIKSDTLIGIGEKRIDLHNTTPFSGKIAISDIEFIGSRKFNIGTTCLAAIGISLLTLTIALFIAVHDFNENFNGCNQRS